MDSSSEFDFVGEPGRWFFGQMHAADVTTGAAANPDSKTFRIGQISAADLGCKNMRTMKPILIEHLLSEEDFVMSPDALGIYIPADEILKRTAYQWFAALCPRKVLESNTMIAKYLLSSEIASS